MKVAVLVFIQELGTDVNLYALVFGESVLNDAVNFNTFCSGHLYTGVCEWIILDYIVAGHIVSYMPYFWN